MSKRLCFSHFTPRRPLARGGQAMTAMLAEQLFFGWAFLCTPSYCGNRDPEYTRFCGRIARPPSWCLVIPPPACSIDDAENDFPKPPETITVAEAMLDHP